MGDLWDWWRDHFTDATIGALLAGSLALLAVMTALLVVIWLSRALRWGGRAFGEGWRTTWPKDGPPDS